jgi:predicted MPP superfamily phosphohydrolase
LNRRKFVGASAGLAAGLALEGFAVEPADVELTEHEVAPRRSSAQRRVLIAQVSDVHVGRLGSVHRRIADEIERRRPDVILVTGDLIDDADNLPLGEQVLAMLPARTPKLGILGNWEHWCGVDLDALGDAYRRHGGRLLVNETAVLHVDGRRIAFTGMDDLAGTPDLHRALSGVEPADAHVMMAHSPAYRDRMEADARPVEVSGAVLKAGVDLARYRFDVVLSGHSHGGQVAVLGFAPLLPDGVGPYVRGWFRHLDPPLFVSRGIGTSVIPVRVGSRPEVAFHTLWA